MLAGRKRTAAAVTAAALGVAAGIITFGPGAVRFFRQEAVISIVGDILLDRGVAHAIAQKGAAYPYEGVTTLFQRDDITIANLECPLTQARGAAMKAPELVFKADPGNAETLKSAGFDVLVLANNHTMDYLSEGLTDTMQALGKAGLRYAGAGQREEEIRPCFLEKNGLRVGILSYSSLPPEGFLYDGGSATIAYARAGFLAGMQRAVRQAAAQCDFLIVYFHWGDEYRHDASGAQIEIAHAAADSGASVVIGAHPHVLQGTETYQNVPIYYSIGNFVFDKQIPEGTDKAVILQFTVNKSGIIDEKELPVVITDCQPCLAGGPEAAEITADLLRYSRRFSAAGRQKAPVITANPD